jgi:hypothetical protein
VFVTAQWILCCQGRNDLEDEMKKVEINSILTIDEQVPFQLLEGARNIYLRIDRLGKNLCRIGYVPTDANGSLALSYA